MDNIQSQFESSFLQSADWAAFQAAAGQRPIDLGDVYAYVHRVGPFRYAYMPRTVLTSDIVCTLKKKGMQWIRVEGPLRAEMSSVPTHCRQPQQTLILDLRGTLEELLAAMHSKTRYNIRLAERKGVVVKRGVDVEAFWSLTNETTQRDGFKGHDKSYYKSFLSMPMSEQFTAYVDSVPIAAIITTLHNGIMTYVHGASSNSHRNLMAPYLLQWSAMQHAKESGATTYDMWGVSPIAAEGTIPKQTCYNGYCWPSAHEWTGITRFKVGFGGNYIEYAPAVDVPLQPLVYKLYKKIHAWKYGTK